MAVLATNALTLVDHAKRLDPDGKSAAIVEMLSQTNQILDDMVYAEGNLPTGHRTTIRTGLPSVYWRKINEGVQPSKSSTAQVDEGAAILEAWSEADVELAKLSGNVSSFRLSEASAFIEAMGQEHASTLFYGNSATDPEEFNGLAQRYSDLSAENAQNIVVGGGAGSDNTSIWLVCWGMQTVHGIFPKSSKAGIEHEDLGIQTVQTQEGLATKRLRAYQDRFLLKTGLVLKDWRYAVRIPNIDVSDLVAGSVDVINLMIKAMHRIPNMNMGRCAFYMNRTVMQYLDIQRRDDVQSGGQLSYKEVDGKWVPAFRGIPIKLSDALLETEDLVS